MKFRNQKNMTKFNDFYTIDVFFYQRIETVFLPGTEDLYL